MYLISHHRWAPSPSPCVAPVIGCLLAGLDRKLSARMQGRVGPPILQPYYDLRKLLEKDRAAVNNVEGTYVTCALVFAIARRRHLLRRRATFCCRVFVLTLVQPVLHLGCVLHAAAPTRRSVPLARRCRSWPKSL